MSLLAGKPHAAKTDQPGDFRQYHEHQDQQPVFGAARSSGEIEIMAERPLDQLADGHDLVSNSGMKADHADNLINILFARLRECVFAGHLLDRKAAVMSPSRASKVSRSLPNDTRGFTHDRYSPA